MVTFVLFKGQTPSPHLLLRFGWDKRPSIAKCSLNYSLLTIAPLFPNNPFIKGSSLSYEHLKCQVMPDTKLGNLHSVTHLSTP